MMIDASEPGTIDGAQLRTYVDRAAAVMTQQKELAADIAAICTEADEAGVASKREIRKLAKEALMDQDDLQAQLRRMDELRAALADFAGTPLGSAAVAAEEARIVDWPPKPFAKQPVHAPRRRKPRPVLFDQEHPDGLPPAA